MTDNNVDEAVDMEYGNSKRILYDELDMGRVAAKSVFQLITKDKCDGIKQVCLEPPPTIVENLHFLSKNISK